MNIKKGDTVKVVSGKERGKTGKVLFVDRKNGRVTLEGLNLFKKHKKPSKQGQKGEVVSLERSMDPSKVMLLCGGCKKAVRVGIRQEGEGKKSRVCKNCGAVI